MDARAIYNLAPVTTVPGWQGEDYTNRRGEDTMLWPNKYQRLTDTKGAALSGKYCNLPLMILTIVDLQPSRVAGVGVGWSGGGDGGGGGGLCPHGACESCWRSSGAQLSQEDVGRARDRKGSEGMSDHTDGQCKTNGHTEGGRKKKNKIVF